jgi:hypothetical protein
MLPVIHSLKYKHGEINKPISYEQIKNWSALLDFHKYVCGSRSWGWGGTLSDTSVKAAMDVTRG